MKKAVLVFVTLFSALPSVAGSFKSSNEIYVHDALRKFDGREETRVEYDTYQKSHDHFMKSRDLLVEANKNMDEANYARNKDMITKASAVRKIAYEGYEKAMKDCHAKEAAYIVMHLERELPLLSEKLASNAQGFKNLQK